MSEGFAKMSYVAVITWTPHIGLEFVQQLARTRPDQLDVRHGLADREVAAHHGHPIAARVGNATSKHRDVRAGRARERAGHAPDLGLGHQRRGVQFHAVAV
jgi:hypothetical protein